MWYADMRPKARDEPLWEDIYASSVRYRLEVPLTRQGQIDPKDKASMAKVWGPEMTVLHIDREFDFWAK